MIRTRMRKILRDIMSRKTRTLLVSISIFIGVFGTIMLFSMRDLLVRQLEDDLEQQKLAMVRTSLAANPETTVDNERLLSTLREQPDVTTVEGQAVYPLVWRQVGDEEYETSFVFAYSEPYDDIQLEPPSLMSGDYPRLGQNELAIERRFADKYDLETGDELVLRILSEAESGDQSEETWIVSGIIFFPYGYPGLNDVLPEDSVFAAYDDARYVAGFEGFSSIYARFTDFAAAEQQTDAFTAAVAAEGSYVPVLSYTEDPADHSRIRFARTIGNIMASLALLALFVSGFLVWNVISALITEQTQQIGIMKSLGASQYDIIVIYCGIALTYGLLGIIPGVILGIPAGFFAAQGLATTANSLIDDFGYSIPSIALGIGSGILVPVLAALIPAWRSSRVQIREAIADRGISSGYGRGPLSALVGRLPLPMTVRQGLGNVLRKRGRMALTGAAIAVAVAAFSGVLAAFLTVDTYLDDIFSSYNYQFGITPNDPDRLDAVRTIIENDFDQLTLRGPAVTVAVEIEGFDREYDPATGPPALFATGYDPSSQAYDLELIDGQTLTESADDVIVSRGIAEALDKQVGDVLTISAGGHSADYEIAGITSYPLDNLWFTWETLSSLAGFTDDAGNPIPGGVYVEMSSADPTADEVADTLQEIDSVLHDRGITASYSNIVLLNESISQGLSVFQVIFNFAAILVALVGAIGLFSTLSISVFERQKEIGIMRSVGAGSRAIATEFLTEGYVVGLAAWIIGLPLSYMVSLGLLEMMNVTEDYQSTYPPRVFLVGLVGVLVITSFASIWPSIAAARKRVSDILRYQ
ncbi:MAG: ABC transporter permease [Chloroflexi bacterium]|nr:ABC transporter permease [Chloroflexota bacterium]